MARRSSKSTTASPTTSVTSTTSSISIKTPSPHNRSSSISKGSKIVQFFSSSPKSSVTNSSLHSAPFYPPTSLPTISLSPPIRNTQPSFILPDTDSLHHATSTSLDTAMYSKRTAAQYGPISDPSHKHVSVHPKGMKVPDPVDDEPPYYYLFTTYLSYLILIVFGHVRDFLGKRFRRDKYHHLRERDGYAPLNSDFDNFYVRRLKQRINDCFSRPVTGVPGRNITLLDRYSVDNKLTFKLTGSTTECLNMSSYNYLGFAQSEGPCADAVEETTRKYGTSSGGARSEAGTLDLHVKVEDLIARFVGKPASMVFSMGFGTNATAFPALVSKGCLVISDELNHSSIRFGARLSGSSIRMFKHNDMRHLEKVLRDAISQGQPRTHRPWKKILVAVEGLYSMEGTMCNLPGLVELKHRYKFFLYVDEAHSIGALGPRGRGVCDYFNIDPAEVDILMGTLTKSFGAAGGYIAATKPILDKLRLTNAGFLHSEAMSPVVLQQIQTSLRIISGEIGGTEGEERLQRLAFNSRYLRVGLKRLGFIVDGHDDSPIVPLRLYNPGKMPAFSHEMLKRKIAVVIVGYPATPLVSSRARFCVSAAHNKEDLDKLLKACDEIGDVLQLKFSTGIAGAELDQYGKIEHKVVVPPRWPIQKVIAKGAEDAIGHRARIEVDGL
ncbi:serine palmitoyltransferase component [Saitoella coloradoensis]